MKTLKISLNTDSVNEIAKFSKLEVRGRQEAPSFFLCKALHLTDLAQGQSADVSQIWSEFWWWNKMEKKVRTCTSHTWGWNKYEIVWIVWMGWDVKHFGQDVALNRFPLGPGTLWKVVAVAAHLLLKVSKLTSQLLNQTKESNYAKSNTKESVKNWNQKHQNMTPGHGRT